MKVVYIVCIYILYPIVISPVNLFGTSSINCKIGLWSLLRNHLLILIYCDITIRIYKALKGIDLDLCCGGSWPCGIYSPAKMIFSYILRQEATEWYYLNVLRYLPRTFGLMCPKIWWFSHHFLIILFHHGFLSWVAAGSPAVAGGCAFKTRRVLLNHKRISAVNETEMQNLRNDSNNMQQWRP